MIKQIYWTNNGNVYETGMLICKKVNWLIAMKNIGIKKSEKEQQMQLQYKC